MKLYLLDGTYELFRNYFGAPSRVNQDGTELGAVFGWMRSTAAFLRKRKITHIAVAFDTVIESFRNELFDGYKSSEGVDEELLEQFPWVEQAAQAMGLVKWGMREFEADDALATAARRFAERSEVEQILLCSPDKDLTQCVVDRRVVCLDRRNDRLTDQEGVRERFGIEPESIPDYLALVGDSADGIPGLRGWGKKSTSKVLARFSHIEDIPENPDEWKLGLHNRKTMARTLKKERKRALFFRKLTLLRTDVPLAEDLPDLQWQGVDFQKLKDFCAKMGDESFADSLLKALPDGQSQAS